MLAMWTPHIVHVTYFDYTLQILQHFEKTKCANFILKVLEN